MLHETNCLKLVYSVRASPNNFFGRIREKAEKEDEEEERKRRKQTYSVRLRTCGTTELTYDRVRCGTFVKT